MFSVPFFFFHFPYSFFSYWGDQCTQLYVISYWFDTIILQITTLIQMDKMHISAKIVAINNAIVSKPISNDIHRSPQ